MHTSHSNHYNATLGMHTGSFTFSRPSIGSWVSYGLGTMNRNLPGFVVIAPHQTYAGTQVYASDFLPAAHQGTLVVPGAQPVANITPQVSDERQRLELEALREMNQDHLAASGPDPLLAARLKSFETAFGMQMAVPEAFDLAQENDATLGSYGLERDQTSGFGWQCLVARRLVERGVRFVELIDTGSSNNWDAHGDMLTHVPLAKNVDQPVAALLADLGAAACSTTRWSSGPPSSVARRSTTRPTPRGASIIPGLSAPGWPVPASSVASPMANPTSTVCGPWSIRSTCTTFTPRSCT